MRKPSAPTAGRLVLVQGDSTRLNIGTLASARNHKLGPGPCGVRRRFRPSGRSGSWASPGAVSALAARGRVQRLGLRDALGKLLLAFDLCVDLRAEEERHIGQPQPDEQDDGGG